jgi:hypothetical protein
MLPPYLAKRRAHLIDMFGQQPQPSLGQIHGEEEAAPCDEVATLIGHAGALA